MVKEKKDKIESKSLYYNPKFEKYVELIKRNEQPEVREALYKTYEKTKQKQAEKKAKEELYGGQIRKEKIIKGLKKVTSGLKKQFLEGKVTSKAILKKAPRATYVIPPESDYRRSSFFNEQYEREKNLLAWK